MVFPFPALVGQERVKQALMMLAVNPRLTGLLIRGEKGTAKSTAARGLARLMPSFKANKNCLYNCTSERPDYWCADCRKQSKPASEARQPAFETLPLGITEDQLLGTFDLERALKKGEKRFEPGMMARVNQGVLYVDEVNLLDDHIVDLLLDCAASGVNTVAREGVAMVHPSEFLLVGTMNPEEGELRPQLIDRFGLCAEISAITDPESRAEIVARCLAHERAPQAFVKSWAKEERALTKTIARARKLLPSISPEHSWYRAVATLSLSLGVHGHRADILMVKAAATLAALDGRTTLKASDMESAATLVYPHRLKRQPFAEPSLPEAELREQARAHMEKFRTDQPKKKRPAVKKR